MRYIKDCYKKSSFARLPLYHKRYNSDGLCYLFEDSVGVLNIN